MRRQPPIDYIERTRAQYDALGYPAYDWVKNEDSPPWAEITKPINDASLAVIASGGLYVEGQIAFHYKDDISLREIDVDAPTHSLRATHFAYDLAPVRSDPNVVFPLAGLKQLVEKGQLGELAKTAYTFMGGIYSARKVGELIAPAIANRLQRDQVDLALLVPA
jgi:D-proline reductase (dithiol) PrdB